MAVRATNGVHECRCSSECVDGPSIQELKHSNWLEEYCGWVHAIVGSLAGADDV